MLGHLRLLKTGGGLLCMRHRCACDLPWYHLCLSRVPEALPLRLLLSYHCRLCWAAMAACCTPAAVRQAQGQIVMTMKTHCLLPNDQRAQQQRQQRMRMPPAPWRTVWPAAAAGLRRRHRQHGPQGPASRSMGPAM